MLMTPASRQAAIRQTGAPTTRLFPQGRRARELNVIAHPDFHGSIYSQGAHRGNFRGTNPRGVAFGDAFNRAARQLGVSNDANLNSDLINNTLIETAEREVASLFTGPAVERNWARTDARAARIQARGGQRRPRRRSGPQTRRQG
jgi:hypothetical protein